MGTITPDAGEVRNRAMKVYFQHGAYAPYVVRDRLGAAVQGDDPAGIQLWTLVGAAMEVMFDDVQGEQFPSGPRHGTDFGKAS